MPNIVRYYIVDRLKPMNLEVEFQDQSDYICIYVKHREFTIQYIVNQNRFYIRNVKFAYEYEKDYQLLFIYEKELEPIFNELVRYSNYLKLERNQ